MPRVDVLMLRRKQSDCGMIGICFATRPTQWAARGGSRLAARRAADRVYAGPLVRAALSVRTNARPGAFRALGESLILALTIRSRVARRAH